MTNSQWCREISRWTWSQRQGQWWWHRILLIEFRLRHQHPTERSGRISAAFDSAHMQKCWKSPKIERKNVQNQRNLTTFSNSEGSDLRQKWLDPLSLTENSVWGKNILSTEINSARREKNCSHRLKIAFILQLVWTEQVEKSNLIRAFGENR